MRDLIHCVIYFVCIATIGLGFVFTALRCVQLTVCCHNVLWTTSYYPPPGMDYNTKTLQFAMDIFDIDLGAGFLVQERVTGHRGIMCVYRLPGGCCC